MSQPKTVTIYNIRPKGFNIGNDVIYLAMQDYLTRAFDRVVNLISIPATSRYESHAKAGLSARTVHDINQHADGVIVGGGNLYENGELEVNLNALQVLDVPLMLFSLSKGRIFNRRDQLVPRTDAMPDQILAALNRKATYSLARDEATLADLRRLGIDHAEMGGCPTVFLQRMVDRLPPVPANDARCVLISVRAPDLMNVSVLRQAQVRGDVLRIIDFLRGRGHADIRILCHDHRDIAFASSLGGLPYHYTDDVYSYLALLRSAALNVTYRLHSALPCMSFGVPAIVVSYDERALSAMASLGLGAWDIDMVRVPSVVDAVIDRYERLGGFESVRAAARPRWDEVDEVMNRTFRRFAADVLANAADRR